ncbi:MAG: hypothetical protein ACR2MC_13100 [Actinomycetota bacterium]
MDIPAPTVSTHLTPAEATLKRLLERSQRQTGLQLPPSFARARSGLPAPLSAMIQGGRGGDVRLKLYLTTALLAGSNKSHKDLGANAITNVSGAAWARALALPNPSTQGARRVAAAQNWLHEAKLVNVERRPASEPLLRLRSADGSGRRWTRPTSPYIRVPLGLWRNYWIWVLDATELAVFIALIDFVGSRGADAKAKPQWMYPEEREQYGLSDDTWRLASASLQEKELITTDYGLAPSRDFEGQRHRRTYQVLDNGLDADALQRFHVSPDRLGVAAPV